MLKLLKNNSRLIVTILSIAIIIGGWEAWSAKINGGLGRAIEDIKKLEKSLDELRSEKVDKEDLQSSLQNIEKMLNIIIDSIDTKLKSLEKRLERIEKKIDSNNDR